MAVKVVATAYGMERTRLPLYTCYYGQRYKRRMTITTGISKKFEIPLLTLAFDLTDMEHFLPSTLEDNNMREWIRIGLSKTNLNQGRVQF
nr:hypothetical protein Iba_scaffold55429CG0010 [Ipomoea batatas]